MNALAMSSSRMRPTNRDLLPQFNAQLYLKAIEDYRSHAHRRSADDAMMLNEKQRLATTDLSSVEFLRMGSAPVSHSLMEASTTPCQRRPLPTPMHNGKLDRSCSATSKGIAAAECRSATRTPKYRYGWRRKPSDAWVLENEKPGDHERLPQSPRCCLTHYRGRLYITATCFAATKNGFHYFVGRTDDMFVSGGENIFPAKSRKCWKTHPDVVQACVVP